MHGEETSIKEVLCLGDEEREKVWASMKAEADRLYAKGMHCMRSYIVH